MAGYLLISAVLKEGKSEKVIIAFCEDEHQALHIPFDT